MKMNRIFLPIIALIACLQSAALIGMEAVPTERQNIQRIGRTASAPDMHSNEYNQLKKQKKLEKKMAEAKMHKHFAMGILEECRQLLKGK